MVAEGMPEKGETDRRTDELRRLLRRNIKLNKRSIFCSLFLTRVELRHFATLFSLRAPFVGRPRPPFLFITPFPCRTVRVSTLFLPLDGSSPPPPQPPPASPPPAVSLFRSSRLSLSLSGLCVETSRAEERHSIKVEYVRLGLFFTLGGVQIVKSILPPKFRIPPPTLVQRARAFSFLPISQEGGGGGEVLDCLSSSPSRWLARLIHAHVFASSSLATDKIQRLSPTRLLPRFSRCHRCAVLAAAATVILATGRGGVHQLHRLSVKRGVTVDAKITTLLHLGSG